ncbi:hypothetical protein [Aliikangiella sp. IMCC44359]|uniref:hypothetical protein n=1 Tax=Aliikangiella sp. IMCC44359 TaxID=3459125 RepID=UPI00403B229C
MKFKNSIIQTSISFALFFLSGSCFAVDFSISRTNPNTYSDGVLRLLPLDNANNTSRWVYFGNTTKRAVFYNAECQVKSADNFTWYNINLEIVAPGGGVTVLSPSNSDNALCSSKGNNSTGNWSSNSTHGTYTPTVAGWHQVRVRGQLMGYSTGESVRIDDVSLIINN